MASVDRVASACLADALDALGVRGGPPLFPRRVLARVVARPVRRLAGEIVAYDADVATAGLQQGAAAVLTRFAREVTVCGGANVARDGPLLIVANHPGLTDAPALFAHVARADLRVIAARRRLLSALPATAAHLFVLPTAGSRCPALLRTAIEHMRRGGALLTFPAGRIEPDPAHRANDALDSLAGWSSCVRLFARRVPGLTIVPAAVGGVLSQSALAHPLIRLRHNPRERDWLAATLQMLEPALRDAAVRLVFGEPIDMRDSGHPGAAHARVTGAMAALLKKAGGRV